MEQEIILITGGCGFLGQHIVRELQLNDPRCCEIRVLDLTPYKNRLGHHDVKEVRWFKGDITNLETCKTAFQGVHCVIHCAANIDYSFPANSKTMEQVNVQGTRHVIELCLEAGVSRLLFCSTAEVALRPRLTASTFHLVMGQNEVRALPPINPDVLPPYVASKLRAEKIVLAADKTPLSQGAGMLRTVSLRPTLLYGELEPRLLSSVIQASKWTNGKLVAPTLSGGSHQFTYAGNAAWAHILAKDVLLDEPDCLGGLPVFVTDDTRVEHAFTLASRLLAPRVHSSVWLPTLLTWPLATLAESVASALQLKLPVHPTLLVSFLGGYSLFNRLRADIHLKYEPRYTEEQAVANTRAFLNPSSSRLTL